MVRLGPHRCSPPHWYVVGHGNNSAVHLEGVPTMTDQNTPMVCGAWPEFGGCQATPGHNMGNANVPANHTFPGRRITHYTNDGCTPTDPKHAAALSLKAPTIIPGVGKDTRSVDTGDGVMQGELPYLFTDLDARALFHMAQVMAEGNAKYGPADVQWRRIDLNDHINHALAHLFAFLAGDGTDDHLGHAACRVMGALQKHLEARDNSTVLAHAAAFGDSLKHVEDQMLRSHGIRPDTETCG
jgi:Domain of unknown function (DUF5664)